MENMNRFGLMLAGLFLATGIAGGGYFVSNMISNGKLATNIAESKGLAEMRVEADQAAWIITYRVTGHRREEIPFLYKKAEKQQQKIIALLKENGFDDSEIGIGVIDYNYSEFRDKNNNLVDERHQLVGLIGVETGKVHLVAKVRNRVNRLIARGIDLENRRPMYRYTRLNEIKPAMLREATRNARLVANEFAANAGVKVGGIKSARQGRFSIHDVGEDYSDTTKIRKMVRVVTTIKFYLTD